MDTAAQLTSALSGRYAIEREIGAGGMATVYLAQDVRHHRLVALKVLKPELGAVLGVERFLAEIRVTANLQHPNLLPLFDSGEAEGLLFYVMPFIDGENLGARLDREKQLPIDDAIRIATSVASALDYAHRHGVIHRDLKPANILLHEGQPLVADFGIALAVTNAGGSRITQTGLSLGTPQYMSPEQATGDRVIDGRTDIYSLGAVLYEMLVGDPPHLGGTAQAVIAKVLTDRPRRVRASRASVPAHVDAAIECALEKLPADRFATAHEFAEALAGRGSPVEGPAGAALAGARTPVPAAPHARIRDPLVLSLAGLLVVAAAVAVRGWTRSGRQPDAPPSRFVLTLPQDVTIDNVYLPLTISHDGRQVILRGIGTGTQLFRRAVDQLEVKGIAGTDDGGYAFVSADDKWVGFVTGGQLRKVPIEGGPSIPIAAVAAVIGGAAWAPNDVIVVGGNELWSGLSVVSAAGGPMRPLTKLDTARGDVQHRWPHLLPDGKTVVYTVWPKEGLAGVQLAATSIDKDDTRLLDVAGSWPVGMAEGHLLYVRADGVLMGVPFDLGGRRTAGTPVTLLEGININTAVGAARAELSRTGTLVYLTGSTSTALVSVDSAGVAQTLLSQDMPFYFPAWSPDGRRIAMQVGSMGRQGDIWMFDFASRALTRVTSEGPSTTPAWSPDGKRIIFSGTRGEKQGVWWQPADGSGAAEPLLLTTQPVTSAILAPDGHTLVYRASTLSGRSTLWVVDLSSPGKTPHLLLNTRFQEVEPAISPDGRWIAYVTTETGSTQVYVRPFGSNGGVTQVSADGGNEPVWAPNGKILYYRRGRQVIAVPVTLGQTVRVGARRMAFEGAYFTSGALSPHNISISPDGKHFAVLRHSDDDSRIVVVTNWLAELRARTARQ